MLDFCQKCGKHDELQGLMSSGGGVQLCPTCYKAGFQPSCGEFHHPYQGWHGGWLCMRCGAFLKHTPITTARVEAATAPTYDDYV